MRPPSYRLLLPAAALTLALPLLAQSALSFKHFHRYPDSGQWSTVTTGIMNGKPTAAPVTSTACASPLSPARRDALLKSSNPAAASCKTNILRDEERTAEYEQVCTFPQQTTRSTMHAVDDRTISIETKMNVGPQPTIEAHSTVRYLGPCTAAQAVEAKAAADEPLPSMKPSAEDCAELASSRQQAEESLKSCTTGDVPEAERASCKTTMSGVIERVKQVQQSCAR